MTDVVLDVQGLAVDYSGLRAVDGVSFQLHADETIGVVGESGCGKSSMGRALVHMPGPSAGTVTYRGTNMATLTASELRRARLDIQMVFQDPRSSLHPLWTIEQIVSEPLRIWKIGTKAERREKVREMLIAVGLDPEVHGPRRPSELSGGQCQRVAIARALVAGARVLVCDEPISSLDVSLRATVLNLLEELKVKLGLSIVFIAHDLAVVRNVSDRILVMYLGTVVEAGPAAEVFDNPQHPYTRALIASVPTVDADDSGPAAIVGEPPSPLDVPSGCRFRARCPFAQDICAEVVPEPTIVGENHVANCHFAGGELSLQRVA